MTTATPTRMTNVALGKLLGLDHSSVSRLRRGQRGCSVQVMLRLDEVLGWTVREQVNAFDAGTFGPDLESRLLEWTATRPADHDTPATS
jgi:hypothetical protein